MTQLEKKGNKKSKTTRSPATLPCINALFFSSFPLQRVRYREQTNKPGIQPDDYCDHVLFQFPSTYIVVQGGEDEDSSQSMKGAYQPYSKSRNDHSAHHITGLQHSHHCASRSSKQIARIFDCSGLILICLPSCEHQATEWNFRAGQNGTYSRADSKNISEQKTLPRSSWPNNARVLTNW